MIKIHNEIKKLKKANTVLSVRRPNNTEKPFFQKTILTKTMSLA